MALKASQVWELHDTQGFNLNIKISQYNNTLLANDSKIIAILKKNEDLKSQRSLNSDSTCHNICKKKCLLLVHQCLHIVLCLSPLLLSYFMTLWKQTASTSDLKTQSVHSYTNFVTRWMDSLHSYIWMSEPSTHYTAAVPTSLHSASLLTEQKMHFLPGRPILWKCCMSKMTSGHYCHRDTVKNWQYCYIPCKCGSGEHHLPALTRCYLLCFPSVQRSKRAHHTDAPE